jgi:hypothetical protein
MLVSSYGIIHTNFKIGLGLEPVVLLGACLAIGGIGLGLKNKGLIGTACLAGIILCERLHFLEMQQKTNPYGQEKTSPLIQPHGADSIPYNHKLQLALPAVYLSKERKASTINQ